MEPYDTSNNIISNKIIEDEKIEWVPLSLTLVEYPKGIKTIFLHRLLLSIENEFLFFCDTHVH